MLPFGLKGVKITLDGDRGHPQPDAAAARRSGHLRSHHREHPAGGRTACQSPSAATSTRSSVGSYPGAARLPAASRSSPDKLSKVNFKPIIRNAPARRDGSKGVLPLIPVERPTGKPLGGTCMTSAGKGSGSIGHATRCDASARRRAGVPARTRRSAAVSRPRAACPGGPCHVHMTARPHDRPGRFALRVPRVHRRQNACRRGTSTTGAKRGAKVRGRASSGCTLGRVRRLRVYSGVRRWMPGGIPHTSLVT